MARLWFENTGVVVRSSTGESILSALRRNGYTHRFGCRRGGCGTCKVQLVSGVLHYPVRVSEQVLTPAERASGVWLSCRAVADGDVVIRLQANDRLRCVAPVLARLMSRPGGDGGC